MLNKNINKIRRLKGKRYSEELDLVELENLEELEVMYSDDMFWDEGVRDDGYN